MSSAAMAKLERAAARRLLAKSSNEFIVEFHAPVAMGAASADAAATLHTKRRVYSHVKKAVESALSKGEYEILTDYDALPMQFVRSKDRRGLLKLLDDPNVKAVYESRTYAPVLTQSLPLIGQVDAVASGFRGTGATVAVLDTGVDYRRASFGTCTAPGVPASCKVVAALDTAADDRQLDDRQSMHGTNVAGIVAGVAPGARIAALDVFGRNGLARSQDITAAINWAISNQQRYNIVALNLSLGDSSNLSSECTASWATRPFAEARAAGILPVVAAGNNGYTGGLSDPACAPGAVRVGAVYDENLGSISWSNCTDRSTRADRVTCFSNSGPLLTLLAPGARISAGGAPELTMGGTSQAAPHVAGAIAVLRAPGAAPEEDVDATVFRLTSTGTPVTDHRNGRITPRLNLTEATRSIHRDAAARAAEQPGALDILQH
ncbi:S8 family serine peptidase [Aquabacterium sp. A7-Y]|uniref:S8 family serine peptidase n=1 Tax=Aquabacterium sp. A7-Y TaxID=1349605 RepID=UPI00223DF557|nr:S8 family serine peptidase [Aquabacterium sp. A7-Y]MCW7537961.1 S8 family serine peptidase [Aquabacterium sp. A7-Y]